MTTHFPRRALVIGASRGLGLELARVLIGRGWQVTATARRDVDDLRRLALRSDGRLVIASLEMTDTEQLTSLRGQLSAERFDLLVVNAAIDRGNLPIHEVSVEMFTEVMITNALSPVRALEVLGELVEADGTMAVMSSEQGSVALNTEEGFELYKASKAALNQLIRSYATRHRHEGRTKLLIDPGHNQTRLGGFDAPLLPAESMRHVADVVEAQAGAGGLQFLDRFGVSIPW